MDFFVARLQLHARQEDGQGPPAPPLTPEEDLSDQTAAVLASVGCLYAIALSAVLLRAWVRVRILKAFGLDDGLMAIAMLLSTACLVSIVYLTHYGLGKHVDILRYHPDWTAPLFAWLYFFSISIISAYSFIKLSIAIFLLRLAQRTKYTRVLQGALIFLVLFTIGSVLPIILQCRPVAAGYDLSLRPPTGTAKCYSPDIFKKVGVFNSSINIATDLLFALLPIPMVWRLQVNLRTKVGLIVILGLGLFAAATAIYKTPMQYHFFEERDFTGHGAWYYVWQIVEMNVGILAASLPCLKPLFISFFEKARAMTGRSARSNNQSGYFQQPEPSDISLSNLSSAKHPFDTHVVSVHANSGSRHSDEAPLHERKSPLVMHERGFVKTSEVHVSQGAS